jgi:hypothetical protein
MTTKVNASQRNAMCNAAVDRIDAGTGAGRIEVRTGTEPTNVGDASSGTLLGTLTFSATAFGNASSGVATASSITSDTSADNSGDAGYFRCYQGAGGDTAAEWQGKAGNSGDSPEMTFDNKAIVAGGTIAISSFTFTVPASS